MPFRIVSLVPMRHHSERVPGKNYRMFLGRPLYHYIVESLLACERIGEVVIDTDSPTIIKDADVNFPNVKVLERPEHLRAGEIPMNDVLLNTVAQVRADFYMQTHCTNPLLSAETIAAAIDLFFQNLPVYDSLFSVTRWQTRLWDRLARPINHNAAILLRTQDLPAVYEENSCIYVFSRKGLEQRHSRVGDRPLMFEIDRREAIDIDDELDFQVAEFMYKAVHERSVKAKE